MFKTTSSRISPMRSHDNVTLFTDLHIIPSKVGSTNLWEEFIPLEENSVIQQNRKFVQKRHKLNWCRRLFINCIEREIHLRSGRRQKFNRFSHLGTNIYCLLIFPYRTADFWILGSRNIEQTSKDSCCPTNSWSCLFWLPSQTGVPNWFCF